MLFLRMRADRMWALSAVLALALCLGSMPRAALADAARPNVVLIVTDDEDLAAHAFMPKTRALIEDQGATFANYFISYPWCCPSRASILRGQYAHNTNIVGNEPPWGGYETFHGLGLEQSTLATWLQAAGYRTAMIGKYLNRYVPEKDGVPPGWDEWAVGGNAHASYDYVLNENGRAVQYGSRPEDYLNDVLTGKATEVIRASAATGAPFFLYVLPFNPHSPSVAAPRHEGMFADAQLPRTPSFDEADVSDKPAFIRDLPPLTDKQIDYLTYEYRRRIASLQGIDDMVESIVGTLRDTGQLDDTYVIYSSDNGFHMGAHRLIAGKDTAYEEDIRVPMVMRGPGIRPGSRIEAMVGNIDLAPTIAAIAGIQPPDFVDGRSFLPLLGDPDQPWREAFLIERRRLEEQLVRQSKDSRLTPEELERTAVFNGIRTADSIYVEYGTGERELYDLRADPFQLDNRIDQTDPALLAVLEERLAALAVCAAGECRRLEDLPLPDPGAQPADAALHATAESAGVRVD
jgi:N-acetylglucosamine-6-sulfatase